MNHRERYQYRLEHGLCTQCGAKNTTDTIYCERCRDRRNELHKITTQMRIDMGVCIKCGKNDAEPDHRICKECINKTYKKNKDVREYFRSINICPRCQRNSIVGDEKSCIECRTKISNYMDEKRRHETAEDKKHNNDMRRQLAKKWEEKGICNKCGSRPAVEGIKVCQVCRNKRHMYYERGRFEREETKRIKKESGLCYFCDKPVAEGLRVCAEHHEKLTKNSHSDKAVAYRKKMGDRYYRLNAMKKAVNK